MEVDDEIQKLGGRAVIVPADVANSSAVFSAAEQMERTLGPIDIWINDAMVTVFSPLWDISPDEFRRVTEVTYLGVVHGTMAALQHMRNRNRGTIRSDQHRRIAEFLFRQRIAEPSTPSAALATRCGQN